MADDPRPDKQGDRTEEGGAKHQDTGTSTPRPAPGGVGTGTHGDPAERPGAGTGDNKK